jgi:hypothetical protein
MLQDAEIASDLAVFSGTAAAAAAAAATAAANGKRRAKTDLDMDDSYIVFDIDD